MIFYWQEIPNQDEYGLMFSGLDTYLSFYSKSEMLAWIIDYQRGAEFELVEVDENNREELLMSGAFD
ncbi:hypothetical protein [Pseudoalteromonas piratica]|uniref:Uncharacterized protein n=1 Tax=Pseudoalteromonas piratica TaxID=1348114 RepID=A0A0A7EKL7_9GAMM|nr:hypothetical protein [Pseudoalteromonas piratica]AIY67088.1 hypothetical protein OM33_18625 [Pseudoalteromonas piratica]